VTNLHDDITNHTTLVTRFYPSSVLCVPEGIPQKFIGLIDIWYMTSVSTEDLAALRKKAAVCFSLCAHPNTYYFASPINNY